MKLLKKRPISILIAAAVILLSTIFSAHRTLGAKSQEVIDSFYTGVYDKDWGTFRKSIDSQLRKRHEAANNLISIASNYAEVSDSTAILREKREAAYNAKDIEHRYNANKDLSGAFSDLYKALEDCELSSRDKANAEDALSKFNGAQNVIESSGYNEYVLEFERSTLNVFPANILKNVAFVKTPELFQ